MAPGDPTCPEIPAAVPDTGGFADPAASGAGLHPKLAANIHAYRTREALELYTAHYGLNSVEELLVLRHFRPGDRVLDLACGGGRTTVPLHESGYRVVGVDLSDPLIEAARQRFPLIDFRVGSYCRIDFPAASFDDVLISYNGLDYAFPEEQRSRALAECARVLAPGGRLIFSSHNLKSLHGSPYFLRHPKRFIWMVRQARLAFRPAAYVEDLNGQWTYFASPGHVHDEVDRAGFDLADMVGFRQSRSRWFNTYCSPWIHYACIKRD